YYGAPWKDEKVLVLTSDGSGDGLCSTVYIGEDGNLNKIAETPKGSSIGNIYSRVTFTMGLVPWEHEWKVMGMAPYAPESGMEKSYEVFKKYLSVPDRALTLKRNIPEPTYLIYPRLRRELELHRFDWISAGIQRFTEEILCKWVKNAIEKTGIHKVALGGGVFMNVKANKNIMEMKEVEDMFVFPSCGDESNSIGAAYQVYAEKCRELGKEVDIQPLREMYFGPSFTDDDVEKTLTKMDTNFSYEHVDDIEKRIAEIVREG
ncbi:MAG: carbamoyltransferase N-terminal domain-containing protein, partial [Candidatus Thermoplasmatota archaeon]|nr:carbamoyltransferase N-terminal domain-containing protein [Candidatus Thermoplasmatota archaeon]